jgi:hypothetical protein
MISVPHAHPSSHAPHAAAPVQSGRTMWVTAGVISMLTVVALYFAFREPPTAAPAKRIASGSNPSNDDPAGQAAKNTERTTTTTTTTTPTSTERTHSMFDEMVKEHDRAFDPAVRKATAAKRMQEAAGFYQKHPQDPWAYLDLLRQIDPETPARADAAKAIIALKLPLDKSETPGWYRDWAFSEKDGNARKILHYDFGGRKNVVQTTPMTRNSEIVFKTQLPIPADKPHLIVTARGDKKGSSKIAIEIDGKQQLLDELTSNSWRDFDLDVSYFKGRSVEIQLRQIPADVTVGSAYWAPPALRAQSPAGATIIAFNSKAQPYVRPKPVAPPPHIQIAPTTWKESAAWKSPVDLLALTDPKTGAVAGKWSRDEKGALSSNKADGSRLAVNFKVPAQYDIRAVFERVDGNSDAVLILTHDKHPFVWQMGADQNKYFDIAQVAAKKFDGNPAAVLNGNCLKNKERYTTVVEVRKDRISAYLNGAFITEWTPDMGELSVSNNWKLADGTTIGVGAHQSEIIFHSLELVEVK